MPVFTRSQSVNEESEVKDLVKPNTNMAAKKQLTLDDLIAEIKKNTKAHV